MNVFLKVALDLYGALSPSRIVQHAIIVPVRNDGRCRVRFLVHVNVGTGQVRVGEAKTCRSCVRALVTAQLAATVLIVVESQTGVVPAGNT